MTSTITCPRCPGQWIKEGPRYVKLEVWLDANGQPTIHRVLGSSEWPDSVDQTIYTLMPMLCTGTSDHGPTPERTP